MCEENNLSVLFTSVQIRMEVIIALSSDLALEVRLWIGLGEINS